MHRGELLDGAELAADGNVGQRVADLDAVLQHTKRTGVPDSQRLLATDQRVHQQRLDGHG